MTKEHNEIKTDEESKDKEGHAGVDETNPSDGTKNTEEEKVDDKTIPYDRFKEKDDEVNALKKKLDAIDDAKKEDERKQLEAQQKYKELYEKEKERNEQNAIEALNAKKDFMLSRAGYSEEQAGFLRKLVEGESDEEIKESIETLKASFPTKSEAVDPSAMNGHRDKHESKGGEGFGKSLYDKVMGK